MFISIDIEKDDILDNLVNVREKISRYGEQKFVTRENMHITLGFLGNVSIRETKVIKKSLNEVNYSSYPAEVKGISTFPSSNFIRTFYAETEYRKTVELRNSIHQRLPEKTKQDSKDRFIPHITLSRVRNIGKKEKIELQKTLDEQEDTFFGSFQVKEFRLKESFLKKDGVVYKTLERYELDNR